ncbi:DUF2804 domain-containing protein [Algiphilus sp. NNCM1]|nr:DUF2804 domain-containing protein [Algiphilus acroporae]MCI5062815.1 DUF2804 domain-containing protein [Algiphilus sp.]
MSAHQALPAAPAALHAGNGRAAANGRYLGAIENLSTAVWDGRGRRRLQRKGWIYFGAFSERTMVGYAVADAGLIATAFVYVYDRQSDTLVEEAVTRPMGFAAGFAPDWRQPWHLSAGDRQWSVQRSGDGWHVSFQGRRLQLALTIHDGSEGLTAVCASPGRPFHHTYKLAGLRADISGSVDGKALQTEAGASVDFSLGYPPRETQWNWLSVDGHCANGEHIAINGVAHFLNGFENALWCDGKVTPLSQMAFDYDPAQLMQPWQIRSLDGRVNIVFTPEARRGEHRHVGLLASRFTQPCGRFEGTVQTAQGPQSVQGYGVVEEHWARW